MTFTLPEELAVQFLRQVPAQDRSRYVAQALSDKLAAREHQLILACEIANQDPDLAALEREFDLLPDDIKEPWNDPQTR